MHSQNSKIKKSKHILEIDFFKIDVADYLNKLAHLIKQILSSPESALLLSDMYDDEFGLTTGGIDNELIGPALYRHGEDTSEYNTYSLLLDIYLRFDIKKFFGININEFTNMTKYTRNILIDKAESEINKITKTIDSIEVDKNMGENFE